MPELRFYGASDDLVEIDGAFSEEAPLPSKGPAEIKVSAGDDALLVVADYGKNGTTWALGVSQVDEDVPLPAWPVTIRQGNEGETPGYSVTLVIEVPEEFTVHTPWLDEDDN